MKVHFSIEQIKYLMVKLGITDPDEAIDKFAEMIQKENIDPAKIPDYLDKLMKKDGFK